MIRVALVLVAIAAFVLTVSASASSKREVGAFLKAAKRGDLERVTLMLQEGIDPNVVDRKSRSALYFAVDRERVGVAEHLLTEGANPVLPGPTEERVRLGARYSDSLVLRELLGFHRAKALDTTYEWEKFVRSWKRGAHLAEAKAELGWRRLQSVRVPEPVTEAWRLKRIEALAGYLDGNPGSRHGPKVQDELARLRADQAVLLASRRERARQAAESAKRAAAARQRRLDAFYVDPLPGTAMYRPLENPASLRMTGVLRRVQKQVIDVRVDDSVLGRPLTARCRLDGKTRGILLFAPGTLDDSADQILFGGARTSDTPIVTEGTLQSRVGHAVTLEMNGTHCRYLAFGVSGQKD